MAVAGTGFALYLIYLLRGVVELIVLGVFVALWLGPFVEFLTRRRTPRVLAILAAYLTLFGSLVFLGLVVVPPIADQIGKGVRQLPAGISRLRENAVAGTTTSTRSPSSWKAKHGSSPAGSRASRRSCPPSRSGHSLL